MRWGLWEILFPYFPIPSREELLMNYIFLEDKLHVFSLPLTHVNLEVGCHISQGPCCPLPSLWFDRVWLRTQEPHCPPSGPKGLFVTLKSLCLFLILPVLSWFSYDITKDSAESQCYLGHWEGWRVLPTLAFVGLLCSFVKWSHWSISPCRPFLTHLPFQVYDLNHLITCWI